MDVDGVGGPPASSVIVAELERALNAEDSGNVGVLVLVLLLLDDLIDDEDPRGLHVASLDGGEAGERVLAVDDVDPEGWRVKISAGLQCERVNESSQTAQTSKMATSSAPN